MAEDRNFPDFRRLAKGLRAMKYDFSKKTDGDYDREAKEPIEDPALIEDDVALDDATLLTSRHKWGRARDNGKGMHRVVLDIDMDAALIPSSTPGNHHLIIDKTLPWKDYVELLRALSKAGIIQPGYAKASIARGYSAIRPPWVKKEGRYEVRESGTGNMFLTTKVATGGGISLETLKNHLEKLICKHEETTMIQTLADQMAASEKEST